MSFEMVANEIVFHEQPQVWVTGRPLVDPPRVAQPPSRTWRASMQRVSWSPKYFTIRPASPYRTGWSRVSRCGRSDKAWQDMYLWQGTTTKCSVG